MIVEKQMECRLVGDTEVLGENLHLSPCFCWAKKIVVLYITEGTSHTVTAGIHTALQPPYSCSKLEDVLYIPVKCTYAHCVELSDCTKAAGT
jgi:hypothetical protein